MLKTRKTMVSWQAFPSLPPRAPLAFLSPLKLSFPSLSNACLAGYKFSYPLCSAARALRTRELRYEVETIGRVLCFEIDKTTMLFFIAVDSFGGFLICSSSRWHLAKWKLGIKLHQCVIREIIRELFCFYRRSLTGSETFSLLTALDATKFVLLCILTLKDTICPKIWATD